MRHSLRPVLIVAMCIVGLCLLIGKWAVADALNSTGF
jgi:hypothetical protein